MALSNLHSTNSYTDDRNQKIKEAENNPLRVDKVTDLETRGQEPNCKLRNQILVENLPYCLNITNML